MFVIDLMLAVAYFLALFVISFLFAIISVCFLAMIAVLLISFSKNIIKYTKRRR